MTGPSIEGSVAPGFEKVHDAFARNFEERQEVGASFAVLRDGLAVVDLWGGFCDRQRSRAWTEDTLINVYSTTKGMTALCAAILVDRGELDYGARMTDYWPEFGAGGKDALSVEQVLSHQAGLSGLRETIVVRDFADWSKMTRLLAAQEPFFVPGRSGYHAITFGFLVGELVRRISGRTVGRFFADEVALPLGADVWIGLPESEDGRVAEILAPLESSKMPPPRHPAGRAALGNPVLDPEVPNERWYRAAEIPAANGQATGRGLARVYGMLARGGELGGRRILSAEALRLALRQRVANDDLVLQFPIRWGAGYILNDGVTYGPNRASFGHSGWGGSFACADPDARLGIGYAMNQMGANLQGDPRSLRLLEAVYECV
ncbi:MAG: serine hydrolase [Acidobacteria bacterium]|nr:serine hydrolase [Acidobacteriota bacterium]